jgi:hypothetical protein
MRVKTGNRNERGATEMNQIQTQTTYEEVLNGLEENLNQKFGFNAEEFLISLKTLKDVFGKEISTDFIRNLMKGKTNRQKTFRIAYILKLAGLNTAIGIKPLKYWGLSKRHIEVVEYIHAKGKVYSFPCELSEEEQAQIKELKGLTENTGVEMLGTAEREFNERQRIRNAINGFNGLGGAEVKEYHTIETGKDFFSQTEQKVLHFIKI